MPNLRKYRAARAALGAAIVAVSLLAGCNKGSSDTPTQTAVKVNKDEITVLEINEQISRLPGGLSPDQVDQAKRNALDSLVHRKLLVQQAIEQKLERDPAVLSALESARENILAQAYVTRVITPQAKPSEQEIHQYYVDNPDLFSQRKIFRVNEFTIGASPEQSREIQAAAPGMNSLDQLGKWLGERKIPFAFEGGVRNAEQLPMQILPKVAALRKNEILVFLPPDGRLRAVQVLDSAVQPVEEKMAAPVIEGYLTNTKRDKLATEEVQRLQKSGKIEYLGEYARIAAGTPAPAPVPAPAPAAAAGDASKEKGISGLK